MTYLGTIKKLRLKIRWEEGSTDHRITGPNAQWELLINCGKENFIALKSLHPPKVHYYRKSSVISNKMWSALVNIGADIDQMTGESMTTVDLKRLPELCKIVGAKKKRKEMTEAQKEIAVERLKSYQFAPQINGIETGQESTQD